MTCPFSIHRRALPREKGHAPTKISRGFAPGHQTAKYPSNLENAPTGLYQLYVRMYVCIDLPLKKNIQNFL